MNQHCQDLPQTSSDTTCHAGALAALRVLDLSRVTAGPWCTQTLADLGADVIKIERPGAGDDSRSWAPPFMRTAQGQRTAESVSFAAVNRGKRSIELDMADAAQAAAIRALAAQADVLVENFKFGALEKYGLDYASLSRRNPRLIYCSITGFGQTGPYRERPGYDTIIQGMCGLMSVNGQPDGAPGGGPLKIGVPVVDIMAGLYATIAVLAALQRRAASGHGQQIDLSLFDVGVASMAHLGLRYLTGDGPPRRHGNRLPTVAPSDAYPCRDGRVMLIIGNDAQFRRLCAVLGQPGLAAHARFATNASRLAHSAELDAQLCAALAGIDADDCVARCSQANVPCGPINDMAAVFADPQVRARDMVRWVAQPGGGSTPIIASPLRLSESPPAYRTGAPALGQHNGAVDTAGGDPAWPARAP